MDSRDGSAIFFSGNIISVEFQIYRLRKKRVGIRAFALPTFKKIPSGQFSTTSDDDFFPLFD